MARVYGAGFYCRALDFEQGQAIALEHDDSDEAWEREPTLWEAVGDWEGGNMTPIPLPTGSSQSSWLEEAWAAWAAIDEADQDESKDSERNSQEINPAALDWLMGHPVN
jgi:hypothetical protein